ncbi:MAG TPA: hypothetical protein VF040_16055 [Ktedonobacterales bacterium]
MSSSTSRPIPPRVDLSQVSLLAEIVLRGGNIIDPRAQAIAREHYQEPNEHYQLEVGLSCLFRPGATLDELAREGTYPNSRLSVAIVQRLVDELAVIGCTPVLYVTPAPVAPDHHTLVFLRGGMLEAALQDDMLQALVRASTVVPNPYRRFKPQ